MEFPFDKLDIDVQGEAYENYISTEMKGKVWGQFFTPTKIKNIAISLLDEEDFSLNKLVYDPAMGTGGFLISYLRQLYKRNKNKDLLECVKYISGREIDNQTYKLSCANLLLSTGEIFNLEEGDTLNNILLNGDSYENENKYDIILTNPPYGIKKPYDDLYPKNKDKYIPFKSNNAVLHFLQSIIYMLKVGGKAVVILPDGQEIYSKTKQFLQVRDYMLKTCKLHKVVYLPAGLFEYTNISTCILYFEKVVDHNVVLKNKNYKYSTDKVCFYDYKNDSENKLELINEYDIDTLIKNKLNLKYKIENKKVNDISTIINKYNLSELIKFLPKSKRQASYGKQDGKYPFFTSSNTEKYCDEADYNIESIIIGDGGSANIKYSNQFSCSDHNYVLVSKEKQNINIKIKYIYYYLNYNIDLIQNGFLGIAIKNISKEYLSNIVIPLPPLETQQKIVDYCDNNIKMIEQINKDIEFNKNINTLVFENYLKKD